MSVCTPSAISTQCKSSPRLPWAFEISPTVNSSGRLRSRWRISVVLPAPISPVITVIGACVSMPYSSMA